MKEKEIEELNKKIEEELGSSLEDDKRKHTNIKKDDENVKQAWAKLKAYGEIMRRKKEENKRKNEKEDKER